MTWLQFIASLASSITKSQPRFLHHQLLKLSQGSCNFRCVLKESKGRSLISYWAVPFDFHTNLVEGLSWIHTRSLHVFSMLAMSCSVFHSHSMTSLMIKSLCRVLRILCYEHETLLKLNFFQIMKVKIIIYHSVDMNGAISLVNSLKGYFCIT